MTDSHRPEPDYDERGVPSLEYLRERIEGRLATSSGAAELAKDTGLTEEVGLTEKVELAEEAGLAEEVGSAPDAGPAGPTVEQEEALRAAATQVKLEEIRRSLGR